MKQWFHHGRNVGKELDTIWMIQAVAALIKSPRQHGTQLREAVVLELFTQPTNNSHDQNPFPQQLPES